MQRKPLTKFNIHLWTSVQVQCMILDAWGWCTGTIQRDGMGRVLESLQGQRDLIEACVRDLIFLSREGTLPVGYWCSHQVM